MTIPDPERYDQNEDSRPQGVSGLPGGIPEGAPDAPGFPPPGGASALRAQVRQGSATLGKMAFIAVLIGLLLIPVGMIKGLILEREGNGAAAEREVADKWGGGQVVTGPILTIPYRTLEQDSQGKVDTSIVYARFLPERLEISGALEPEIRHRGIYDVALFKADLHLKGSFARPDFSGWRVAPENILWDAAFVSLAVPDVRSLAGEVPLSWAGSMLACAPENYAGSPVDGGLHAAVPVFAAGPDKDGYAFETRLALNGSGSMQFLPMGKETRVSLSSPWESPSFSGAFLPRENRVGDGGFDASWATFRLSRPFPQAWRDREAGASDWSRYAFGVDLKLPVDRYQKTMRCAKYAVLFILLTFLVFFMSETMDRARIHPLQYAVVGSAICLFYLLLLALTEHVPFALAYAAAAAGMAGMITAYGAAVLGRRKRAYALGGMLAGLYAYLFTLLQMEDYALLMGAFGLTAILGAVMLLTRKLGQAPAPALEAA